MYRNAGKGRTWCRVSSSSFFLQAYICSKTVARFLTESLRSKIYLAFLGIVELICIKFCMHKLLKSIRIRVQALFSLLSTESVASQDTSKEEGDLFQWKKEKWFPTYSIRSKQNLVNNGILSYWFSPISTKFRKPRYHGNIDQDIDSQTAHPSKPSLSRKTFEIPVNVFTPPSSFH